MELHFSGSFYPLRNAPKLTAPESRNWGITLKRGGKIRAHRAHTGSRPQPLTEPLALLRKGTRGKVVCGRSIWRRPRPPKS